MKDMANVLLIMSIKRERTRFDNESRQRSLSSANNNRVGQVFALISRMTPQTKLVTIRTYFTNSTEGITSTWKLLFNGNQDFMEIS